MTAVGDRVAHRETGEIGMVVAHQGDRPVVSWDVAEEFNTTTEDSADLVVTKGVYKSQRRGYRSSSEAGRAR
jgi:CMP-2-keto-3-deoxyoctulosonic acid synthetase